MSKRIVFRVPPASVIPALMIAKAAKPTPKAERVAKAVRLTALAERMVAEKKAVGSEAAPIAKAVGYARVRGGDLLRLGRAVLGKAKDHGLEPHHLTREFAHHAAETLMSNPDTKHPIGNGTASYTDGGRFHVRIGNMHYKTANTRGAHNEPAELLHHALNHIAKHHAKYSNGASLEPHGGEMHDMAMRSGTEGSIGNFAKAPTLSALTRELTVAKAPRILKIMRDGQPHPKLQQSEDLAHHTERQTRHTLDSGIGHIKKLMDGLDVEVKGREKKGWSHYGRPRTPEEMKKPLKPSSIVAKLELKNRHLMPREGQRGIGDLAGYRITARNPAHFEEAQRRLDQHQASGAADHPVTIHNKDDFTTKPLDSGYRSVHYDGHVGGVPAEIQVRHPHHTVWADHFHMIHKPEELRDKHPEIPEHHIDKIVHAAHAYGQQTGDYLHRTGGKVGDDFPKAPYIMRKYGLEVPTHTLPRLK